MQSMASTNQDSVTRLIHHDYQPPAGFSAPQPGIFKASTVIFPSVAAIWEYLRLGTKAPRPE